MSNEWSKDVFAKNLNYYMLKANKNQKEMAAIVGVSAPTFHEWLKGKKFPRIDKIEKLAQYFGILKSDLIEEKTEEQRENKQKNSTLSDLTVRMLADDDLLSLFNDITKLDEGQLANVKQIVSAFLSAKN